MEPIESDFEYVERTPYEADPRKRFNWLLIVPILGSLWLLYLLVSVIFQLPVTPLVNPVMSFMLPFFFIVAGLLFWAMEPKANRE
ncbi:MAG: hypothetical protein IMW89_07710 [Ktedonobacteraceae bacterium]|nr:hypothetical protein [Ktedonobacteraceae bacterium]